ncbi:MAG: SRPBCC domain-containing protein [Ilumatobacteraceae bacterium]
MAITRHQYRIFIKAPIDQVWSALLDPAFTRRYFHDTAFDSMPQAGAAYRTSTGDGRPAVDGTIEVLEPPHRLVQTWHVLYDAAMEAEPPSRVEWTLTVAGEGLTRLDLVHGDLARSPLTWATVKDGWVYVLDGLKTVLETGEPLPAATAEEALAVSADPAGDWHRAQGIECNNGVWEMVAMEQRTAADDEEMLRRAYASAYHWQRAARRGPENEARSLYMLAKAHLLAGLAARSLHYADACLAQCMQHGLVDFDLAYAHEARARALRAMGREDEGLAEWAAALAVPVTDPDDKAIVDGDFADAP